MERGCAGEAAVSLGELGGEEAVNGLVSALAHYDALLVENAEKALRKLNDPCAVSGLLESWAQVARRLV